MEAPAGGDPADDQGRADRGVPRRRRPPTPRTTCAGQYDGYRAIDGVAADSTTETYAALRLDIDNWRWSGVPFFIRTGKRLPVTQTEVRLVFKQPPRLGFGLRDPTPQPNQLVIKLDPSTGIKFSSSTRAAGLAARGRSDPPRHGVRRRGRRGRHAVRGAARTRR